MDKLTLTNWFDKKNLVSSEPMKLLLEGAAKGDLFVDWEGLVETSYPIIQEESKLYFKNIYLLERRLAELVKDLIKMAPDIILKVPCLSGHALEHEQKSAIELAFQGCLTLITGGPGTGKTYTAGILLSELLKSNPLLKIAIAAPTGKAALHLKQSLSRSLNLKEGDANPLQSFTLHRLLNSWREEHDKLAFDLILVDESSMIDLKMMVRLFESLMPGSRLILMGDPNQLPPVEAGSVFADLAQKVPKAHLVKCLRAELQEIVDFSNLILHQDAPAAIRFLKQNCSAFKWNPSEEVDFKISEMPLLTPLKKGPFGTEAFNARALREGVSAPYPIMITRNHDLLELYNGDMGTISSLQAVPGEKALIRGREFPALIIPSWELAWALSIHKCQGSEFPKLRAFFAEGSESFGVAALYTAVTRAKRYCEICATEKTLTQLIETSSRRKSNLINLI